ncbi:MAG TPA: hypothetical protein DCM40_26225, partial [Maribacter sp.]|nr:hypothetical protein [Maribacter sp.]
GENGVIQADTSNTRFLIDFGSEITTISQSIVDGKIPALNNGHIASASVFLNIKASEANDLLFSYSIKAFPVSQSWSNGLGKFDDVPKTKVGSSWLNRSGDAVAQSGIAWDTGSAH